MRDEGKALSPSIPGNTKADVLFVTMPFCDQYMPCITLALFKAVLARAGIKSRVQHEFLYFANRIGVKKYQEGIMHVCTIGYGHDYFACEAIFADAAHDGKQLRSFDEYLRWMREKHLPGKVFAGDQRNETLEKLALFEEARDMAEDYLDEAVSRVKESGAKIVAFLSMYQQQNATIALAKRLKKEKDAPIIMAGGANCEGDAGQAMIEYFEPFDYIFTGEADEILAPMCHRLLRDGKIADEELPDGVVSRTRMTAPPAKITKNLDALPIPDFSDYFRERDALLPDQTDVRIITAEDSRGCWWAAKHPCRFCGLNGSTAHLYREKSTERLLSALHHLAIKAGALDAEILAELVLSGRAEAMLSAKAKCARAANAVFEKVFPNAFAAAPTAFFRTVPLPGTAGTGPEIERRCIEAGVKVCHSDRFSVRAGNPRSFIRVSVSSTPDLQSLRRALNALRAQTKLQ